MVNTPDSPLDAEARFCLDLCSRARKQGAPYAPLCWLPRSWEGQLSRWGCYVASTQLWEWVEPLLLPPRCTGLHSYAGTMGKIFCSGYRPSAGEVSAQLGNSEANCDSKSRNLLPEVLLEQHNNALLLAGGSWESPR